MFSRQCILGTNTLHPHLGTVEIRIELCGKDEREELKTNRLYSTSKHQCEMVVMTDEKMGLRVDVGKPDPLMIPRVNSMLSSNKEH